MAIEIPITDATARTPAKLARRTWRVQFETNARVPQSDWWAIAHREEAEYNAAGALIGTNPMCTRPSTKPRTLAMVAKREFTAAGVTVTGAQYMALTSAIFDIFDQEDADADAARAAAAKAAADAAAKTLESQPAPMQSAPADSSPSAPQPTP